MFAAKSGFGGAEYLLAGLISEGTQARTVLPADRATDLLESGAALRPAHQGHDRGGLRRRLRPGRPEQPARVRAEDSESTQEYTPFEGFELTARVTDTFVRGHRVLADGKVVGEPQRLLPAPADRRDRRLPS